MSRAIEYFLPIFFLVSYAELLKNPRSNRDDCEFCDSKTLRRCFVKSDWCDGRFDCSDRRDENFCNREFPNCTTHQDSCFSGRCIPTSWFCDGQVDCKDGSDEECGGRLRNLPSARVEFKKWVLSQRSVSWGWEKDTPRAIVAMYLMNTSEYSSGNLTSELAAKELQVQLSFDLFRNRTIPLSEGEMSLYLYAMLATCVDPKHFHGLNIISVLQEKISKSKFVKPIAILALCNAGHPILEEDVEKMKKIILKPNKPIWIDRKAFAIMALTCVMKQTSDQTLNRTIFETLIGIKSLQNSDGSFGDPRTSAVIMQALAGYNDYSGWHVEKTFQYLTKQHRNDSDGMLTNYLIMPLLSQRSLLNLGEVNCSYKTKSNLRNIILHEMLEQKVDKKTRVQYSMQIGDNADMSYTCSLRVPVNTTFYDIMRLAGEMDKRFQFQWMNHLGVKYVYSMNSIDNDPELQKYWTLYKIHQGEEPYLVSKGMV